MSFPDGFWWGTAASSTQTEGSAPRSDWARWEREGRAPATGDGNGFATNFRDDFRLLADHGLTHHRLSLEWARLEPEQGKHDPAAVEHYTEVLRAARDAGLDVWACLHHFTLPGWFSDDEGGFVDAKARDRYWKRHVDWVGETFGDLLFGWKPINEPVFYALSGFLFGSFPPGRTGLDAFTGALEAITLANHDAWRLLKSGDKPVATIEGLTPFYPATKTRDPAERQAAEATAILFNETFWSWTRPLREGVLQLPGRGPIECEDMVGAFDLIGFSYYAAQAVYSDRTTGPYPTAARVGPMGYAPWPEGLGIVLRRMEELLPGRAILVDECGLGTAVADDGVTDTADDLRVEYLSACIEEVQRAIDDGIDIRGFFHWTAIDNYEWLHGYDVLFGLFDRNRNPKGSAALAKRYALGENVRA
jgi:beta-glucosidase